MNEQPDRLERAAEIFEDALEKPSAEREAFLAKACGGDGELRQRVDTLLGALPQAEALFEASAIQQELGAAATRVVAAHVGRTGQLLSHYRLDHYIGEGGMGEVYKAWDVALGRPAAVKLLRAGVDTEFRARLLREAETSSRLFHPAIATFYESGSEGDVDFLAMEFVEGETLRSRFAKGAMDPNEALSMIAGLLEGLVHSHAAGIVHRDIKPENIMLMESGAAKLLDFGIAKELGSPAELEEGGKTAVLKTQLTSHGMIVGTIGYMSPEQLRGDPVSESTDVFAMGAVLYEALTGEPAFPGRSSSQRITSLLTRNLPPVKIDDLSSDIDEILRRALARDPADRYPDARAFLRELRSFATGEAVAILPNTIAILDLENVTKNPDDDWIGSGLAESLGADLSRVEELALVPRGKVQKARAALAAEGGGVDPADTGLAIGCRWVLTGSYQRMGPALRLTVRLVEVATGKDVWTEKIDGKVDDIFEIQDRLAELTAESLHVVIPEQGAHVPSKQLDVFELVAKARKGYPHTDRALMAQAEEMVDRALELDPDYPPALVLKANFHAPGRWLQTGDPAELDASLAYGKRALEVDPQNSEAQTVVGYVRFRQFRLEEAIECFERAEELDPTDAMPSYFRGGCLLQLNRVDEAIEALQHANTVSPGVTFIVLVLGMAHMERWDLEAAEWTFRQALELERGAGIGGWSVGNMLAECLRRAGRLEAARTEIHAALEAVEQSDSIFRGAQRPRLLCQLGWIALDQGDVEAARVAFAQADSVVKAQPHFSGKGHVVVQVLAGRARTGDGEEYFEEALRTFRDPNLDFAWGTGGAVHGLDLYQLARAAEAVDRRDEARQLLAEARDAGSPLAARHEIT